MKKTFFMTLFALVFCLNGRGQSCLPNGITLSSQADIDQFPTNYPGCKVVEGYISIYDGAHNITNLNGLSNITTIGKDLAITGIEGLPDLTALNNLTSVGSGLIVSGLPLLTNLNGLNNINSVGFLYINYNEALTSLSGLGTPTIEGGVSISDNSNLVDLSGLEYLTSVQGNLVINKIPLTSLNSLSNITSVGGDFELIANPALSSLNGLDNLVSVGKTLTIEADSALTSLNGVPKLTSVGGLKISKNPVLPNLTGLSSLTTNTGDLEISNMPLFTNLGGLDHLNTNGGNLTLSGNNAMGNLSGLEQLTALGGGLYVSNNPALADLSGLEKIKSVGGGFWIYTLQSMFGLDSLSFSGGGISIMHNPSLASLNGLNNIETVQGSGIEILDNISLQNVAGLEKITAAGHISIGSNPLLTHLTGLDHITKLDWGLSVYDNAALLDLSGLDQLQSIGIQLVVKGNPVLTSLNGLDHLDTIGSTVYIVDNPALSSLNGLNHLAFIGLGTEIWNNATLSDCAVFGICNTLLNAPNLTIFIAGNSPGCNSSAEVIAHCDSQPMLVDLLMDNNGDCLPDAGDTPLPHVQVQLQGAAQMNLRATDDQGQVRFGFLENGTLSLDLPAFPTAYWSVCEEPVVLNAGNFADTIKATLLLKPILACPELRVQLGLPSFFRGCLAVSPVNVEVTNTGGTTAEGVKTAVVLPTNMEFIAATPPLAAQSGDTLYFDLGDLPPFGTANIQMALKTKCDTFLLGQTLCIESFATLDNACPSTLPAFSEIKTSAQCIGDTLVRLSLKNIGDAPTQGYHAYKIIRNGLIMNDNPFSLAAQESLTFDFTADGATWRIEATKLDDGTPTAAAIEHCGGLTPGWITAFWLDHGPLQYDVDCRQVIGSFDPNLKSAVPTGVGPNHTISANQPIQYTIDFQNTGTDTAFRVLLRDPLPGGLDLTSFRPGFASHPYSWEIRNNTLEVLFLPIALPDSNVNEPASHGFFNFSIEQQPNLPNGTVFRNKASIIFDFNPPIETNTVQQRIGQLTVQINEPQAHAALWQVLGNPTSNTAVFRATEFIPGDKQFELFDVSGKRVRSAAFSGQTFEFQRDMLGNGMYFFRITDERGRVFTGKIILTE